MSQTIPAEMPAKKWLPLRQGQLVELLILCGLAVLLLLYLLLRSAGNFSYRLPQFETIEPTQIQTIRWSRADGGGHELHKEGDKWYIGEQKYPAKQSYVDTLLGQMSQPSLQDLVSQSGNLLTFGLDDERANLLQVFGSEKTADGNALRQLYIGKSSSSGRYSYVRLSAEDTNVYTLAENISSVLDKSTDDLRDRLVMQFSSDDIQKLELRQLDEENGITVEKKDDKWQIPQGVTWGEEPVQRLVNRFASMNAQDFIAEFPEAEQQYELQFTAKGGVSYTLTINGQALDNDRGYAAKSSSYGFPFTLNNYTVESMLKDFGFIAAEETEK